MQIKKSRAYYQYMLDQLDKNVSYYSTEEIGQIVYDLLDDGEKEEALKVCQMGQNQHTGDEYVGIIQAKVLVMLDRSDEAKKLLVGNPDEWAPFGIGIHFALDIKEKGSEPALQKLLDFYLNGKLQPLELVDIIDEQFDSLDRPVCAIYLQKAAEGILSMPDSKNTYDSEAMGRIGALLMDCGHPREAIPVLERAIDVDAYDVYSWQDLSRCQLELLLFDDCLVSCEMGLAIDPTNPLFNYARGYILSERKEFEEAIPCLEQVRAYHEGTLKHEAIHLDRSELDQQENIMYELLGAAYLATDRCDKSLECYEILVGRMPNNSEALFRLAMLQAQRGDLKKAEESIEAALQIMPGNETYLSFAVTVYTSLKDYKKAINGLNVLLAYNPKRKTYLLAKAELAMATRDYQCADEAYRSLLKLRPRDAACVSLLRSYFEAIGDEEALKKLNK